MKKYKNKKEKRQSFGFLKYLEIIVLTILVVAFLILIYCVYVSTNIDNMNWSSKEDNYKTSTLLTNVENNSQSNDEDISSVIEKINKSVVGISKIKDKGSTIFLKDSTTSLGLGTGFIVSDDGYIVTNEHVSGSKYSTCYITFDDGQMYDGNVVWSDSDVDLSVVKIDANKLNYLPLGDSDNLKITQEVYAIGNPIGFEFQRTVTKGIISGLDRTVKITESDKNYYMEDLIQTDATINPGNSGGPLIDLNGNVVGINSVKISSAEAIGFASPINIIKPVIDQIKQNKEYKTTTLGIFAYDKNVIPYINQDLGFNKSLDSGIYVAEVIGNSPAEKAGLKQGDILLKIDNQQLNKMSDLRKYIYSKQPGDEVNIKYIRNNKEFEVKCTLIRKI